jgi:hypothetical protein
MSVSKESTQETNNDSLQYIANISGRPGLFRILKPGRTGVIIETLDDKRERSMAAASSKVSILKDVSVYVEDEEEESIPLSSVFLKIREVFGADLAFDPKKSSDGELRDQFEAVLPTYHKSKVYASDIKKIFSWYLILSDRLPELFDPQNSEEAEAQSASEASSEKE